MYWVEYLGYAKGNEAQDRKAWVDRGFRAINDRPASSLCLHAHRPGFTTTTSNLTLIRFAMAKAVLSILCPVLWVAA
jgi:hypothetical protein